MNTKKFIYSWGNWNSSRFFYHRIQIQIAVGLDLPSSLFVAWLFICNSVMVWWYRLTNPKAQNRFLFRIIKPLTPYYTNTAYERWSYLL